MCFVKVSTFISESTVSKCKPIVAKPLVSFRAGWTKTLNVVAIFCKIPLPTFIPRPIESYRIPANFSLFYLNISWVAEYVSYLDIKENMSLFTTD